MLNKFNKIATAISISLLSAASWAKEPLNIGFITTLSTPAGYMGEDERDGFTLAIKQEGGTLGGVPVQLIIEDDGLRPAAAKQSADRMLQDGVRLFTGINFSNVLNAVAPSVLSHGGFYVSLNAGPSNFAGKGCHKNFFSVAMQVDAIGETSALAANRMNIGKMVIIAPNYHAGRDTLSAFARTYEGEILAEIYTKMDQSDFSVELARIRSFNPDAIFTFLPGGSGINFAKQWANSGLKENIKVVSSLYSMDDRMVAATGDAGEDYYLSTLWTAEQDNPANHAFVQAFEKEYGRRPTAYAATAYDTALLLATALKAVDGDIEGQPDAFREALRAGKFDSVRGNFRFNTNHYPIQDWYLTRVKQKGDRLDYMPVQKIAEGHQDRYGSECTMS